MKKFILLLPLLGLTSCTAPKGSGDAAAPVSAETKPVAGSPSSAAESVDPKKNPGTLVAEAAVAESKPARPKPLLSSLFKKKVADAEEPKEKPATVRTPAAAPTPAAPPARKPWFSFLMKKDPPKALVVETPPVRKKPAQVAKVTDAPLELPKNDDGGLRLPDMLTMPEKDEFQSTNPSAVKSGSGGAVIARPPTDPPARPKPKESP